jgi:ABC-type uncharacterized transport system auxiliary subunit
MVTVSRRRLKFLLACFVCVCGCGCCVFLVDRWQHCTKFLPLTEESPVQDAFRATDKSMPVVDLSSAKLLSCERIVSCFCSKLRVNFTRKQWPTPSVKMLENKAIEHIVLGKGNVAKVHARKPYKGIRHY